MWPRLEPSAVPRLLRGRLLLLHLVAAPHSLLRPLSLRHSKGSSEPTGSRALYRGEARLTALLRP